MTWHKAEKTEREYPVAAAIVADGKVFQGRFHGEAILKGIEAGYVIKSKEGYLEDRAGKDMTFSGAVDFFVTNKGRLITRNEANRMGEATESEDIPEHEVSVAHNRNWYKTSKLADKEPSPNRSIFTSCMYCKRWVTDNAPDAWTKAGDLDPDENIQRETAEHAMIEYDGSIGISHGQCPYCSEAIDMIFGTSGYPQSKTDINDVIKMSLMMS